MKKIKNLLFVYSAILSFSLFSYGLQRAKSPADFFLILIFSVPTIYFIFYLVNLFKLPFVDQKKIFWAIFYLKVISFFNCLILLLIALFGLLMQYNYLLFLVFLPLPFYFWLTTFVYVKKNKPVKVVIEKAKQNIIEQKKVPQENNLNLSKKTNKPLVKISDPQRRDFLKMMGVGGVGLIVSLLLNPKKAEAAFFGSVPGPGTVAVKDSSGKKIDPAIKKPTDGYSIVQIDDASPSYYGYQDKDGSWYITRENSDGSFRYARGSGSFSTYWTNRGSLPYDYFENVF
jgi:hypothetical protein